jgi:hypothetical protein
VRQGKGVLARANGERYEGFFFENKFHGKGRIEFADNDKLGRKSYTGGFKAGYFHGYGTMAMKNGDSFKAKWDKNNLFGQGVYTWSN